MSRIDRIRRANLVGRVVKADNDAQPRMDAPSRLPAVIAPTAALPPGGRDADPEAAAAFAAQLMGQQGEKRGLRAGPLHIEAARGAYNKVEWSGAKDRRARTGRNAKTDV